MRTIDIIMAKRFGKGKKGMVIGWPWMMGTAGGGGTETTVTGVSPLLLAAALKKPIKSLTQYGLCSQADTPTPSSPVPIMCNNGEIKYGALGANLLDPSPSNTILGYYIRKEDGVEKDAASNFMFAGYMPVEAGKTYVAYGREKSGNDLSDYNRVAWYDSTKTWISGADYLQNKIAVVTAPENAAYARFSCNPTGTTTTTVTQALVDSYNWMFAEGTAEITPFIPFVGGIYTDGTPEVLTVSGKNVYNPARKTDKRYLSTNGTSVYKDGCSFTHAIPVEYGKTYTFSGISSEEGSNNKRLVLYTDTENPPLQTSVVAVTATAVTGVGVPYSVSITVNDPTAKYIRASFNTNDTNVQMEEGATATTYQPYVAPQIVTDIPMLLSVGDYADEAEIISGIKTGRIGWHVFDGTESVGKSSAYGTAFYIQSAAPAWGAQKEIVMCSHYLGLGTASSASAVGTCFFNASGHFYFRVADNSDTAAFKAWLAEQYANGTPVIVFFALATETTEQATAHALHTNEGDTIITATANVSPIQLEATYMKGE